jgi:hypothetical protein
MMIFALIVLNIMLVFYSIDIFSKIIGSECKEDSFLCLNSMGNLRKLEVFDKVSNLRVRKL